VDDNENVELDNDDVSKLDNDNASDDTSDVDDIGEAGDDIGDSVENDDIDSVSEITAIVTASFETGVSASTLSVMQCNE